MAISITADLVAPHEYEADDKSGMLARGFRVDGLTSNTGITADALRATDPLLATNIPVQGEFHPKIPDLVVRRVNIRPVTGSTTAMRLVIYYTQVKRRLLWAKVSGVTINSTTDRLASGEPIIVGHSVNADAKTPFPLPPKENNGYRYNYARIPFALGETIYEVCYLETKKSPMRDIQKFRGRLNSKAWNGGTAKEWYCETISGDIESPVPINMSELGNPELVSGRAAKFFWITTYRFRYRQVFGNSGGRITGGPGWEELKLFVDERTGRTPNNVNAKSGGWPDAKMGNGWLAVQPFDTADFNDLEILEALAQ